MPLNPPLGHIPDGVFIFPMEGPAKRALEAAGGSSFLREEEGGGVALPPAGASRADTLFSTVGLILVLALAISVLWLLVRRGR